MDRVRRLEAESGDRIERIAAKLGLLSDTDLASAYAEYLGTPRLTAAELPPEPVAGDRLGKTFLKAARVIPLAETEADLTVAMADPLDEPIVRALAFAVDKPVIRRVALPTDIEAAFERLYGADPQAPIADLSVTTDEDRDTDLERLKDLASEAPVIRLVNALITRAVEMRASDIHIEAADNRLRVRYRIDGMLHDQEPPPLRLRNAIVSRIKIMARLNIAERRLPQDGRIRLAVRGKEIDFRVSVVPAIHGESVVLRVLDRGAMALDFPSIGFDADRLDTWLGLIRRTDGIVLVSGPTSSGKTTTLYASLSALNAAPHPRPATIALVSHHPRVHWRRMRPSPTIPVVAAVPRVRRVLVDDAASTVRGIGFAALAYIIWTIGDTGAKWIIPIAGIGLAMFWRGVIGVATVAAVSIRAPGGWRGMIPVRWGLVLLRAGLSAFVSVAWFIAWQTMALSDTYAIGFTVPLIMTALSVPMLHERIRWRRALSTVLGFAGVLVMLRPGGNMWSPGLVVLLCGIVVQAVTRIMTRQLSTTETPECQAVWLMGGHVMAGLAMLPWYPPGGAITPAIWGVLAMLGVTSGLAHCVYTRAYGLAPVSALAPYEYTALIWGGIAGYLAFGEIPAWSTLAGASVVAAAGLYNLHRERVRAAHDRLSASLEPRGTP